MVEGSGREGERRSVLPPHHRSIMSDVVGNAGTDAAAPFTEGECACKG